MRRAFAALCLIVFSWPMIAFSQAAAPTVHEREWAAYKQRFLLPDGRIIDDANGGISHSEGQGYGLLLAWLAGNRADFEQIWSFTSTKLMLRNDGLAVWKWDPRSRRQVTDPNNASDGDLLIAYALALAGNGWNEQAFVDSARNIAKALSRYALFDHIGLRLLKPAVAGFGAADMPDGPIVNPSYWVFEALETMAELDPDGKWANVAPSGMKLLREAAFGDRKLPSDWLSLKDEPAPAEGFPPEFSYNALRIPLYLARAHIDAPDLLRQLQQGMTDADGNVVLVNVETGMVKETLRDAGYRMIPAMLACVLDKTAVPDELRTFKPTVYYPSTLHLLALASIREAQPQCL